MSTAATAGVASTAAAAATLHTSGKRWDVVAAELGISMSELASILVDDWRATHERARPVSSDYVARNTYRKAWGDIPEGYHVHHIDGDPWNNDPENLCALPGAEHLQLHGRERKGHRVVVTINRESKDRIGQFVPEMHRS